MKAIVIAILAFVFFIFSFVAYVKWIEPAIFRSFLNRFENGDNEWSKDSGKQQ